MLFLEISNQITILQMRKRYSPLRLEGFKNKYQLKI